MVQMRFAGYMLLFKKSFVWNSRLNMIMTAKSLSSLSNSHSLLLLNVRKSRLLSSLSLEPLNMFPRLFNCRSRGQKCAISITLRRLCAQDPLSSICDRRILMTTMQEVAVRASIGAVVVGSSRCRWRRGAMRAEHCAATLGDRFGCGCGCGPGGLGFPLASE